MKRTTKTILDMAHDVEASLACLSTLDLPPELDGLSYLAIEDHEPQVSFRRTDSGRKIRSNAAASYFDPDTCEVVLVFVPIEESEESQDEVPHVASEANAEGDPASKFDGSMLTDQLIEALKAAEERREFVALTWFRDQYLPNSGYDWAHDPRVNRALLLNRAIEDRLILKSQVPNLYNRPHPVTAIRVNRRHPRFQAAGPSRGSEFSPVRIRGGSISDTVLADRN